MNFTTKVFTEADRTTYPGPQRKCRVCSKAVKKGQSVAQLRVRDQSYVVPYPLRVLWFHVSCLRLVLEDVPESDISVEFEAMRNELASAANLT